MIKKKKQTGKRPGGVFPVLVAAALFSLLNNVLAQDQYVMTQKELNDFKLAEKYHYQGRQQFVKGKYRKAGESFKKCLDVIPQYSSADYYLAKICYQRQDYQQALVHIDRAIKNFQFMDKLMANAQLQYLKELREEKENLVQDLEDPMQRINDYDRREMENKVLQIDDRLKKPMPGTQHMPGDYHYVYGNIFYKMNKFKEAHDRYVEALRLDPHHADAYNNLIGLFYMVKQFPKAMAYIKQAETNGVKIDPRLKNAVRKALEN